MRAILVFGGTGFFGSNLVKYLLSKNLKVIIFKHKNLGYLSGIVSNNLIIIDSYDKKLRQVYNIDVIYHFASKIFSPKATYEDFYRTNVTLTKKIIDFGKYLKIRQFIFISTNSVFSKNNLTGVLDENTCPTPKNYYGLTKYIAEKLIEIEFEKTTIKTCIIRFPSIFGVNSGNSIVDIFIKLANKNKLIEVYSSGEKLRNLIHVSSAVQILYLVYKKKAKLSKHEVFMAGSKKELKISHIANLIVRLTNSKSKILAVKKSPPSNFDVRINTTKVKKLLGYKPLSVYYELKKYIAELEKQKNL